MAAQTRAGRGVLLAALPSGALAVLLAPVTARLGAFVIDTNMLA